MGTVFAGRGLKKNNKSLQCLWFLISLALQWATWSDLCVLFRGEHLPGFSFTPKAGESSWFKVTPTLHHSWTGPDVEDMDTPLWTCFQGQKFPDSQCHWAVLPAHSSARAWLTLLRHGAPHASLPDQPDPRTKSMCKNKTWKWLKKMESLPRQCLITACLLKM